MGKGLSPVGVPMECGEFTLQEERRGTTGISWYRVVGKRATLLLRESDLFDLTDLLNDKCDEIEEREESDE